MSGMAATHWCWPEDDCTLHDYATFLSVTFALNLTFFIWWNRIYGMLRTRRMRSKDKRDERLAQVDVVREDDGGRRYCETFVVWARRVGRFSSALVALLVVAILLFFRSNSPMSLWWTALTITVGPLLMAITLFVHWVWMLAIEYREKPFLHGVMAAKEAAARLRSSAMRPNE